MASVIIITNPTDSYFLKEYCISISRTSRSGAPYSSKCRANAQCV